VTSQLPPPPNGLSSHPVDVGDRTEAIIVAELVRRGDRVLRPLSANQRYDLVLDLGDRFLRIQCKTGRLRNGAVVFSVRSCRSDTKRTYFRSYSREEADIFLVHCPETDRIYAVRVGDSGVFKTASLRVEAPANNQLKGIRWAVDYELPA
jgi:hypothetical protein